MKSQERQNKNIKEKNRPEKLKKFRTQKRAGKSQITGKGLFINYQTQTGEREGRACIKPWPIFSAKWYFCGYGGLRLFRGIFSSMRLKGVFKAKYEKYAMVLGGRAVVWLQNSLYLNGFL